MPRGTDSFDQWLDRQAQARQRLRGVLESAKLKQHEGKHLTIHKDELPGLADALVIALHVMGQ